MKKLGLNCTSVASFRTFIAFIPQKIYIFKTLEFTRPIVKWANEPIHLDPPHDPSEPLQIYTGERERERGKQRGKFRCPVVSPFRYGS